MSAALFDIREGQSGPEVWVNSNQFETEKLIPPLWLRTRSNDPSERDEMTRQRLINPHLLDKDITILSAQLEGDVLHVNFSDGMHSVFSMNRLINDLVMTDECVAATPWKLDSWKSDQQSTGYELPIYDWLAMHQDSVFFHAVEDFIRFGFLILKNTPTESTSILDVARHFGLVRETNFGSFFEVYSRPPDGNTDLNEDLAYRAVPLSPHTDNPYRTPVPGIQLLHCLINETSGGFSTLVDSLAVCTQLKQEDPAAYQLLTQIPLRFEYRGHIAELVNLCPIIEQDGQGNMIGVHFSPRLCDIPLLDDATTRHLQQALARLSQLFEDPLYELKFKLMPGELMMFDNNRVLHGRTAYDPEEGRRHLQGCYIDRDGPRSHYRLLKKRLELL